jgi:hypothetical protein
LTNKNSKSKSASALLKKKIKEKIQKIAKLNSKKKKNQHSNTFSSEDSSIHPLTFPK